MPRKIPRRQAIKTSLGMIAVPTIVRSATLGRGAAAAASERITLAFIGAGKMANDYHLSTPPRYPDIHTLAVCEVSEARRAHAMKWVDADEKRKNPAYGGCDMTDDFRKIIDRQDIDAVCIATPEHWHTIPLVAACIAGKDVYCEKPLTLTLRESQRCVQAARKHERVVQKPLPRLAGVSRIRRGRTGLYGSPQRHRVPPAEPGLLESQVVQIRSGKLVL